MRKHLECSCLHFIVLTFSLIFFPTLSFSSLMLQMDHEDLTIQSDAIVLGKVLSVESKWDEEKNTIFTFITIEVEKSVKGEVEETVTIRQPGGSINNIALRVDGTPAFSSEEEVLLFLLKRAEGFSVTGWSQGKFTVQLEKDTGKKILNNAHRHVQNETREFPSSPLYLEEMIQKIETILLEKKSSRDKGD